LQEDFGRIAAAVSSSRERRPMERSWIGCVVVGIVAALALPAGAKEPKATREEGVYRIFVAGREVGSEKYAVATTAEGASSTSLLEFRNPTATAQKMHFEGTLEMEANYHPRRYRLETDVDGRRGFVNAVFSPGQVMFEYGGAGRSAKRGLLVGEAATLLDTNIFHHFIFVARLYEHAPRDKPQRFEVVVPQENESGFLTVSEVGRESVAAGGRKHDARHLRVDSGAKQIDLWVDRHGLVQKIAVPAQRIEVVRDP
jgi:hypothetical protein